MHLTVWALFVKARSEWPAGHDKRKYKKFFSAINGQSKRIGHFQSAVKAVCIGRCSLRGLHRDFQPQLFALRTVQPGKTLNDLRIHMDAVDLVLHKDGVALAHHRHDAGQNFRLFAHRTR